MYAKVVLFKFTAQEAHVFKTNPGVTYTTFNNPIAQISILAIRGAEPDRLIRRRYYQNTSDDILSLVIKSYPVLFVTLY